MPAAPPTFGQGDTNHENHMIETLRDHIRESLMGIPNNLPEIKGLQAKLPDARQVATRPVEIYKDSLLNWSR